MTSFLTTPGTSVAGSSTLRQIIDDWTAGLNPNTRSAYMTGFKSFGRWFEANNPECSTDIVVTGLTLEKWCMYHVFSLDGIEANGLLLSYRNFMYEKNLAPATINLRVDAWRSLSNILHDVGAINWSVAIKSLKVIPYRNTKGPGLEGVKLVLEEAKRDKPHLAIRNELLIMLLFVLALRAGEIAKLKLSDLDLAGRRVKVTGKGRTQGEWLTLPAIVYRRLLAWLEVRQEMAFDKTSGPLFISFMNGRDRDFPLIREVIYMIIHDIGEKVGISGLHPHSLRHAAITEALKSNNGNIVQAMRFSRHKDPRTVMVYEDALTDMPGIIAAELEKRLGGEA